MTDGQMPGDKADAGEARGAGEKTSSVWESAETFSKVISAIAIPIVIAVGGWWIQNSITKQSISKDYVALAISVLEKPKSEIDQGLRDWAVDLLDEYAPSKFPVETISRLKSGSINLGALTAALSSKASNKIGIAPDGRVAVGGEGGTIRLFSLKAGTMLVELRGHTAEVTALAFLPDGHLVSGSLDGTVREWPFDSTEPIVMSLGRPVLALTFSPDGRVVVGLDDDTFLTVDMATKRVLERLKLP
jgi:WD40 repeat protein